MYKPGASVEAGVCLIFENFEMFTGYSNHCIGTDAKYAKGAFDRIEQDTGGSSAPGGGFFLSLNTGF